MIIPSMTFHNRADAYVARIEGVLDRYLPAAEVAPQRLHEAMRYSTLGGGKRIRPLLVYAAGEALAIPPDMLDAPAAAIELMHAFSLIHDDLPAMDDDDFRRGRPTSHVQFGDALAILAGDALLTLAFEVLARDVRPAETAAHCCAELASAAGMLGMVGGQVADLEAEAAKTHSLDQLESIHRRKTGRLLSCALGLGGRIAKADEKSLQALETYGNNVGLAFQIADDVLDITANRDKMGKSVNKDADHGKLTYPSLVGVDESREKAKVLIELGCQALAPFGERGRRLEQLAHFVLERDH
jgi:geranylgeranyl diphosphate synthase type II